MENTALDSLPIGYKLQNYEIIKLLGRGGFGITYLARDHDLNTDVAIKEFFPFGKAIRGDDMHLLLRSTDDAEVYTSQLDRFIEEARALAQFNHPSIVRVRRLIEDNDTAYFVMDVIQGGTLGEYIEQHGALKPDDASSMLRSLIEGLVVVHDTGLVHRDIKPDNILLPHKSAKGTGKNNVDLGNPILIDFGTARQLNDSRSATNYVSMGFAPLEQYTSRSTPDARSDIFALASVIYAALAAEIPADANTRQLEPGALKPAAERFRGELSARFLTGLDHGMAILPNDRPSDMREFRTELFGKNARTVRVDAEEPPQREVKKTSRKKNLAPKNQSEPNEQYPAIYDAEPHTSNGSGGKGNKGIMAIAALAIIAILGGGGYALFGGALSSPKHDDIVVTASTDKWIPVQLVGNGDITIKSDGPFRIRDSSNTYLVAENKSVNMSSISSGELEVKSIGTKRRITFEWNDD